MVMFAAFIYINISTWKKNWQLKILEEWKKITYVHHKSKNSKKKKRIARK